MIYISIPTFLHNSKECAPTFDVYIPDACNKEIKHDYSTKHTGGAGTSFHFRLAGIVGILCQRI